MPFHERMLALNQADLSTIYKEPHHAYLRRGIIERQKYNEELLSPAIAGKLNRYRRRWELKQADWLPRAADASALPGPVEFFYHDAMGRLLTFYDLSVRAVYEFVPLPWLRVYRLLRDWVVNPPSGSLDEKTSLIKDYRRHRETILAASVLLGFVALAQLHANPHLMFILFYPIPCALVALVVNTRWATVFVLVSSIIAPMIQGDNDPDYRSPGIFVWNLASRFILLEVITLTLGRIRLEFSAAGNVKK